ncbi:MAG: FAD-dependent thymidylate synthase [Selenomonadaceae bacterium]|nr:FAD-dependent thymidylate synthase [Selenomonadaceae bacterium]
MSIADWTISIRQATRAYRLLIGVGYSPEEARAVLPLCLKSELYMTANLREWRYILKLRTAKAAHPQMREIASQILTVFKEKLPVIVEDIKS